MKPALPAIDRLDLALEEAASEWFLRRRQATDWTDRDEQALSAWFAADPRRRAAFDAIARTWDDLAFATRPRLAPERMPERLPKRMHTAVASPRRGRAWSGLLAGSRPVPAAIAAALVLATAGWFGWNQVPRYTVEIATAAGETQQLALPDGSMVDVNVSTRLQVRYYPRRREASLTQGEAFFTVTPDPGRAFTVDSGASRTTVVGTRFNLRASPSEVDVTVLEGRVQVQADREAASRPIVLGPLQGVAVIPGQGLRQSTHPSADRIGDWRTGRLVFRRTPVVEVARDVARYLDRPVLVDGDARLKALPVSGFADTRAPGAFLDALPDLLPVRVARAADGSYVISAR